LWKENASVKCKSETSQITRLPVGGAYIIDWRQLLLEILLLVSDNGSIFLHIRYVLSLLVILCKLIGQYVKN